IDEDVRPHAVRETRGGWIVRPGEPRLPSPSEIGVRCCALAGGVHGGEAAEIAGERPARDEHAARDETPRATRRARACLRRRERWGGEDRAGLVEAIETYCDRHGVLARTPPPSRARRGRA